MTLSSCKAVGRDGLSGTLGNSSVLHSYTPEKKGKKGYIGIQGKSGEAGVFSHCGCVVLLISAE